LLHDGIANFWDRCLCFRRIHNKTSAGEHTVRRVRVPGSR
jgi:hypothetical protein